MQNIEITNLAIKKLCNELNAKIKNGYINKIQETENNWIKLKIHTKQGTKQLIIAEKLLFLSEYSFPAKLNSSGFAASLKKFLYNKRIVAVKQYNMERIVLFEFDNYLLIIEMFARGNLIVCDKNQNIIAIKSGIKRNGKRLEKGTKYVVPKGKKDLSKESFEEFHENLKKLEGNIIQKIVNQYNISPIVVDWLCMENKIDKEKPSSKEEKKLFNELIKFTNSIRGEECIVIKRENKQIILPSEIKTNQQVVFRGEASKAIEFALTSSLSQHMESKAEERIKKSIEESIKAVKAKIEEFEKEIIENKKKAELLYKHYVEIAKFLEFIKNAKTKENSVMYKKFPFLKKIDLKQKKVVFEFE